MRNVRILGLALALLVGVSCTAGELPLATQGGGDTPAVGAPGTPPVDSGTVTPTDSSVTPPDSGTGAPSGSTTPPADSGSTPDKSTLLLCQLQEYAVTTAVIGPGGGQINVGNHSLRIPQNALSADVSITAEQVEGPVSSVRLSPEGLQFAVPAELFLSYNNCSNVQRLKRVVYTDETLNILELTPSLDLTSSSQVRGLINHFSRYAVAY
ncbi:MAG TPA: hypothetical protein VGN76_08065 [Gemmatimonadales bacterium]|nr:hypothetical protein [Gemmatimonadales bacterium]